MVDFFSRYIEIGKLSSITSEIVVANLKAHFARFGVPELVISDNGPQFASGEMRKFASTYGFSHVTSSLLTFKAMGKQRGRW